MVLYRRIALLQVKSDIKNDCEANLAFCVKD
jgi:hypothetical protein